jgi:catechol 2,3-dioxygenase
VLAATQALVALEQPDRAPADAAKPVAKGVALSVAHIGHVELVVSDLEASVDFFTEIIGLQVSEQRDGSTFLRAWQDFDHHTLLLTEGAESGVGHVAWRVATQADTMGLERELNRRGLETTWIEGSEDLGHGDALRFTTPGGLPFELYWEPRRYEAPAGMRSRFPVHPSRRSTRGVSAVRRFDHVGVVVDDPAAEQSFLTDALGIGHRYYANAPGGGRLFSFLSSTSTSHEVSVVRNQKQAGPAFHHLAFYVDGVEDVLRAATSLVDLEVQLDLGPAQHAPSGSTAVYFKEPSGHRIELCSGGMLMFAPDWEPICWEGEVLFTVQDIWQASPLRESFLDGTPIAALAAGAHIRA